MVAAAAIANTAKACFQLHNHLITHPYTDDVMYMQLVSNFGGDQTEICRGTGSAFASSSATVFVLDCGEYYAEVTDNGRAATVESEYEVYAIAVRY